MEVLYYIFIVLGIIGCIYTRKERYKAEYNYQMMKLTLDADKKKQAEQQISHSRYGK